MWIVLLAVLLLVSAGGGAAVFALLLRPPDVRPADAEALETHLRNAGVDAKITMTRSRSSHAKWQALLYVKSDGETRISTLTRYDTEQSAIAESRAPCALTWNTCQRRSALVLSVREDSWSGKDPARARMLAAFASFRD